MKLNELWNNKELAQGFAGVIVGVFVAVLVGAVLLGPIQTSITNTKNSSSAPPSASTNSTVDNIPLLFGVLLLVGVLGAMIAVIR